MMSRPCIAALLAATAFRADASALVLWPVDPKVEAGRNATMIWVENRGTEAVTLQIRAFRWTQVDGRDVNSRQDDVVASPPVAEVAPGQRQVVRLIRRSPGEPGAEGAYRLLIDELPPPPGDSSTGRPVAHLAVQMRYSIPLFTYAETAPAPARIAARILVQGGKRSVEIRNLGATHVRLVNLRVRKGGGDHAITPGLLGYVLPGAVMRWPMPVDAPLGGEIVVAVDGSDVALRPDA